MTQALQLLDAKLDENQVQLKQKDKELAAIRKKNAGVTTNDKLTAKLVESERCNDELKSEISSLKRIQSE